MTATKTTTKRAPARKTAVKSEPQHPLAHLIPSIELAEQYVSRVVNGIRDIDMLKYAMSTHKNVSFYGDSQAGKTHLIQAYAATERLPVVTVQSNGGVDPTTFWGQWVPVTDLSDEELDAVFERIERMSAKHPNLPLEVITAVVKETTGKFRWEWSEVALVVMHGGMLYINEVNFLHPKTAAGFISLTDFRRSVTVLEKGNEVLHASPNLQIVIDYNPGYNGTRPLNQAFKARFAITQPWTYDVDVEAELVVMIPVMNDIAALLRARKADGELESSVTTAALMNFEELAVDLGVEFATANFLSSFEPEERPVVEEVMFAHSDKIEAQLQAALALADTDVDDDDADVD